MVSKQLKWPAQTREGRGVGRLRGRPRRAERGGQQREVVRASKIVTQLP